MEIKHLDGKDYLTGIKWTQTSYKEVSNHFKALTSEDDKINYGLVCRYKDNAAVGAIFEKKKPKHYAAAIHLANANAIEYASFSQEQEAGKEKDYAWIAIQKLDNDFYWIGAVLNGLPIDEDRVITKFLIEQHLNSLIDNIKLRATTNEDNQVVTVFVEEEGLHSILSHEYAGNDIVFSRKSFSEIVDGVKYSVDVKQKTKASDILTFLLGLAVVGGVAYFAYSWWEDTTAAEEQAEADRMRKDSYEELVKKQRKYEEEKLAAIEKAKELAKKNMNDKLTSGSMESILNNWNQTLGKEISVLQGWKKIDIQCGIDKEIKKTFCTYAIDRLSNGNVGTVKSIKDYYAKQGISEVTVDDKGDKATAKRLNDNEIDIINGDYTSLNGFDFETFKYKNISELQLLELNDIKKETSKPLLITTKIDLPKPPEGIKQDMNFEELNLGFAEGSVIIKGQELFKLYGLPNRLAKLEKPLYIESIVLKAKDESSSYDWEIKANFFVEDENHKGGNLDKIEIPKSEIINKETN